MSANHLDTDRRVTAIVINHNSGGRLANAVRALQKQSVAFNEIIVVDNASTDDSIEIDAEVGAFRLISTGSNLGPAAARNVGLNTAEAELAFIVDADMLPMPDCAANLIMALDQYDAAMAVPRVVFVPETDVIQCDGAEPHFLGLLTLRNNGVSVEDASAAEQLVNAAPSGCLLVRRDCALKIGGFCEFYFFYFEDLEFSQRLTMSGENIAFTPAAVVGHDRGVGNPGLSYRGTGKYPKRRAYLTMRNRLLTIATLYSRRSIILLFPAFFMFEVLTLIGCIFRGWFVQWISAWWWLAKHHSQWRSHRAAVQLQRKRPDSAVLKAGKIPFAAGFFNSAWQQEIARAASVTMSGYWRLFRRWL